LDPGFILRPPWGRAYPEGRRACRRKLPRGTKATMPSRRAPCSSSTRSSVRSARAGWARSFSAAIPGWAGWARSSCCSSTAERALAEARATARLSHENIVAIHELGEHRGTPYIVLEYLKGKTLRQLLDERLSTSQKEGPQGAETETEVESVSVAELWANRAG